MPSGKRIIAVTPRNSTFFPPKGRYSKLDLMLLITRRKKQKIKVASKGRGMGQA
jgi:hypothetical protein